MAQIDRMSGAIPSANNIALPPTPKRNNSKVANALPSVMDPIPAVSPAPEGEKGFFGKMTNTMKGMFGFSGGARRRGSKRSGTKRKQRKGSKKSMRRRH